MSEGEEKIDSERRDSERVGMVTELKYSVILPSGQKGLTKNISKGGLCLSLDQPLAKGTILQVEFDLQAEEASHVKAIVRVLWQKQEEGKFITGVKFLT